MIKAFLIAVICLACKNTSPSIKEHIAFDNNVDLNLSDKDSFHIENTTKEYSDSVSIKDLAEKPQKSNTLKLKEEPSQKNDSKTHSQELEEPPSNTSKKYVSDIKNETLSTDINTVKDEYKIDILQKTDHSLFNSILSSNVLRGKVNYAAIKSSGKLDKYLEILALSTPNDSWSRNEKLAYWINAYNAFTIKLIVDNYPLKSITNLHNGKPWDVKWIKLGNESYSLNGIENDIIRPQFKEPRIHFAVNCAAISCPPLSSKAFTAENLDELLDEQTRTFINNATYNNISKKKAVVSKIFEWYAEDFSDLIGFLNKYSSIKIDKSAKVIFNEYNWGLNNK